MKKYEYCFLCDALTGRAGPADDSLYDEDGFGPYCEECFKEISVTGPECKADLYEDPRL